MCLRELVAQSWTFGCGHDPKEFWFGWLYLQHSQRRFICCRLPLSILQHVRSKTWRPWSKRNNSFVRTPTDNQGTAESLCSGKHGWLSWQKMPNTWPFCVQVWPKWAMWFSRKKHLGIWNSSEPLPCLHCGYQSRCLEGKFKWPHEIKISKSSLKTFLETSKKGQ